MVQIYHQIKAFSTQSFLLFYPWPCKKHIQLAYISQSNDVDSCITLMCFLFVSIVLFLCGIGGSGCSKFAVGERG